jgi:hypothetical protein
VDRGGAVCASDRGWGAVVGAADGESGSRRRSGERWRSEHGKIGWKRSVQLPRRVLEELEKMLGVQKMRCSCASRSWRLDDARGDRGGARAEEMRRGGRTGEPARGREGGGKAGNDVWSHWKAGGGAGDAATVSGGEAQLGQTAGDVARARGGQHDVGEGSGGAGKGTWTAHSGAEVAEAAHMAGAVTAVHGRGEQRRGRER